MSFMQPEIQKGHWLIVTSEHGESEVIPADLFNKAFLESFGATHAEWIIEADSEGFAALAESVEQYRELSGGLQSIECKRGYGVRLSAPGYIDCTPWTLFETEEEANEFISEEFSDDYDDSDFEEAEEDSDED